MRKKCIPLLLALTLLFTISALPASATVADESADNSKIAAEFLAEYFIRDSIGSDTVDWTEDTVISSSVPMYDLSGNINAYSCELSTNENYNGYIVVSLTANTQNAIIEFSDSALPVYDDFDLTINDSVVYTGSALEYYKDDGSNKLVDSNDAVVLKSDLIDKNPVLYTGGEEITDPIAYANAHYQGPFESYQYRNDFEKYCTFFDSRTHLSQEGERCGPFAITNLIALKENYRDDANGSRTTETHLLNIAKDVIAYGRNTTDSHGRPYYTNEGTNVNNVAAYTKECLARYGFYATVSDIQDVTYDIIKNEIDARHPFLLSLSKYSYQPYGSHIVQGYAYTRLRSTTTGAYKSFVKIQDGQNNSARYLDIANIMDYSTLHTVH